MNTSHEKPIIAYHVVFSTYGFWLPNDPRGSWSTHVWARRLQRFGPPIPANTRRSVAHKPHDRALRLAAKQELNHSPVVFTAAQRDCVAEGIASDVRKYELPVYAAAIMPDHVHMVIARKAQTAEKWVGYFKRAASRALRAQKLHPFLGQEDGQGRLPTPWVEGGWKVFLHDDEEILHASSYVEDNPQEAKLPPQQWDWVTPYRI